MERDMSEKYIITCDIGFGERSEIIDATNEQDANMYAYEMAKEDFENNASYGAEPYTKERAIDLGIEADKE